MSEVWLRIPQQDILIADEERYAEEVELLVRRGWDIDDPGYMFDIEISDALTGQMDYEVDLVKDEEKK